VTPATTKLRQPFFIDHQERRLFAVFHPAAAGLETRGGVVFFPPFAEELNRTRRMATLLAEALSRQGIATLIFDYSCTGDSSGRFGQASWEAWIDDGATAIDWIAKKLEKPVTVVGLRLGAAVALNSASRTPDGVCGSVLWQPVTNGAVLVNQFLRIRIASALSSDQDRETTKGLRAQLEGGASLEVAGYVLNPDLVQGIDTVSMGQLVPRFGTSHAWIEIVTETTTELAPASQSVIEKWHAADATVSARTVEGEPFWATQEIATAPALIDATVAAVVGGT
jgi:exosortase A-associated hydrolase 2